MLHDGIERHSTSQQLMPEKADSPAKLTSIQNGYAMSADEVYRNKPFHGTIFRLIGGQKSYMEYVPQEKRLTLSEFLSHKNISSGIFMIDTVNDQGQSVSIEFHVDKNGEQKENANPFLSNYNGQKSENSGLSSALKEEYETQILRLRGQISELTDDLVKAKRQLGDDNTATLIAHKDELRNMEKAHDKEVRELEKEISDLKLEIKLKEMQYLHSDRSGMDRLFDFFEKNGADFFGNILAQIQQANPGQPVSPQQLQAAAIQHMKEQQPENGADQPDGPKAEAEPGQPQVQEPTQATPDQIEAVKKEVADQLTNAALSVLTSENADFKKYASYVKDQLHLLRENGIPLDGKAWVQMAKVLAERAVEENITADKVAKVIEPALEGVKSYGFMLKMMDPKTATDQLFNQFGIEAEKPVKNLVTKVLQALKKSV